VRKFLRRAKISREILMAVMHTLREKSEGTNASAGQVPYATRRRQADERGKGERASERKERQREDREREKGERAREREGEREIDR
jgi:hypothetical protein